VRYAANAELPNGPRLRRVQRVRHQAHVLLLPLLRGLPLPPRWLSPRALRLRQDDRHAREAHPPGAPGQRAPGYQGPADCPPRPTQREQLPRGFRDVRLIDACEADCG
jgi:hypothetical protein